MKNVIYLALFILTSCQLFELNRKNDFILAGISDGLYEFEYDPSIVLSYQHVPPSGESTTKPDTFRIDLNDDLEADFMLISAGAFSSGTDYRASFVTTLNANTYIAINHDNSINVKELNFADTINENLIWSNVINTKYILSTYLAAVSYPVIIDGEWENDNTSYLGIHLKKENQFAWCKLRIKIHKDITLFSYAIQK